MRELRNRGLVESRVGKGTFVAEAPTDLPAGLGASGRCRPVPGPPWLTGLARGRLQSRAGHSVILVTSGSPFRSPASC